MYVFLQAGMYAKYVNAMQCVACCMYHEYCLQATYVHDAEDTSILIQNPRCMDITMRNPKMKPPF